MTNQKQKQNQNQPTATNHLRFDPWTTASTGHQHSDSNPGTAWRRTREAKLAVQLRSGDCAVGAQSEGFGLGYGGGGGGRVEGGRWVWEFGNGNGNGSSSSSSSSSGFGSVGGGNPKETQRDIRSMFGMRVGKGHSQSQDLSLAGKTGGRTSYNDVDTTSGPGGDFDMAPGSIGGPLPAPIPTLAGTRDIESAEAGKRDSEASAPGPGHESDILRGTTICVNGQTAPLVSDHKLKGLLVAHGATLALSLSLRVTHVIIGKPNLGPGRGGAGGGLAAGKIQKEIQRGGWRGIKVVGIEWVLESIKAGKRLPETRFAVNLSSNQRSVLGFM